MIADNIKKIRERAADAAVRSGRTLDDILIVAAAKTNSAESVREAVAAGICAVGENRVQELVEKNALGAYSGAALHFIGHLQKNKVRQLVGVCDLIESGDSIELLELIGKRSKELGITQDVLIEVNIGKETTKAGFFPEALDEVMGFASQIEGISVQGLMAIPPIFENINGKYNYFAKMYNLFVDINAKKYDNVNMRFLSMGMSGDFEDAILSGANAVRIGSAIFGVRT